MDTTQFWTLFAARAAAWASIFRAGNQRRVFDEIDAAALSCSVDFCFDITECGKNICLIFSPEGDPEEARQIDSLVQQSPPIDGWRILGRRERKPLKDVSAVLRHLYGIDLDQLRFDLSDNSKEILIAMPSDAEMDEDEIEGLGNTFAWHAIGEQLVIKNGIRCRPNLNATHASLTASEVVERVISSCQ